MHRPPSQARVWEDISPAAAFSADQVLVDAAVVGANEHVLAVYVAGSRVEGFGNGRSDVDLFLLVDRPAERPRYGHDVSVINGQHLQYDVVSVQFVQRALAELRKEHLEDVDLNRANLQLLHRLCNSVVLSGQEHVAALRAELFDAGFVTFSTYLKLQDCDNSVQDAYGALEAGHTDTAMYSFRQAAQRAFEAVLAVCGETTANEKWVFAKASRALGPSHPLNLRFRSLIACTPVDGDEATVGSYIARAVELTQACQNVVVAQSLSGAADGGRLSLLAERLAGATTDATHRQRPGTWIRRVRGKNVLCRQGRPAVELGTRAALVWLGAETGLDGDALARLLAELRPDLFGSVDLASESVARVEQSLAAAGWLVDKHLR